MYQHKRALSLLTMVALFLTLTVHICFSASATEQDPIVVACVGDSITKGERSGDLFRFSYPAWLQSFLGSGYEVLNFGWGGATAQKNTSNPYWTKVQYTESMASNPDIVIIMLGTNDSKSANWDSSDNNAAKAAYKADLKELAEGYLALDSHPALYIANCAWALGGSYDAVFSAGMLGAISEVAEELNCTLIDINGATQNLKGLYSINGTNVHPSGVGYRYIARLMQGAIAGTGRTDDILDYYRNTAKTTYRIYDEEGWMYFAYLTNQGVNFRGKTVLLENDLDFSAQTGTYGSLIQAGSSASKYFGGVFDGQGHSLSNVRLDLSVHSALFGYVGKSNTVTGAAIRNLTIASGEILGGTTDVASGSTASLASYCYNTTIENVYNAARVTNRAKSGHATGGVVAAVCGSSVLRNVVNFGTVTATYNVGGVAGAFSSEAAFYHCFNGGTLTHTNGSNPYACIRMANSASPSITNCCYDAACHASPTPFNCTSIAHSAVLSGAAAAAMNAAGASMSFSDERVLFPANGGTLAAMVTVNGNSVCLKEDGAPNADPATPAGQVFGGWTHEGTVYTADNHVYTKTDLDALIAEARAADTKYRTGASVAALNNALSAAEISNDYVADAAAIIAALAELEYDVYPNVPTTSEFAQYPGFDAYRLTTVEDVEAFGDLISAGHSFAGQTVYLMNHLDFSGMSFKPLGATTGQLASAIAVDTTNSFRGTLEGNGYSFSNVHIHSMWYGAGLFPILWGATIRNFGVISGSVEGYDVVGGISGYGDGGSTLYNVWSGLDVYSASTGQGVAGLCSNMRNAGTLTNAICWGTVSGTNYIAGLVSWGQNGNNALKANHCCFAGTLDLRGGSGETNTFIRYSGTVNGKSTNMIGFTGHVGTTHKHDGYTILDEASIFDGAAVSALNAATTDAVKWKMVNGYPGPVTEKTQALINIYDRSKATYGYKTGDHNTTSSASHFSSEEFAVKEGDVITFGPCNVGQNFHIMFWNESDSSTTVRKANLTEVDSFDNGQVIYRWAVPENGTLSVVDASAYDSCFLVTKNQHFCTQDYYHYWDAQGGNLYNILLDKTNAFLDADGSFHSSANHSITHFIEVQEGDTISFGPANAAQDYHLMGFDAVKTAVTGKVRKSSLTLEDTDDNSNAFYTYTVPAGVAYVRVVNATALKEDFTVTRNDILNLVRYYDMRGIDITSPLYQKSALFVGDSICYGAKDTASPRLGWAGRIAARYDMTYLNKGKSGTSLSTARAERQGRIVTQLTAAAGTDYDYVILHGGVNDAWDSYPVGVVSESFDPADFDLDTYAGGLEELIYTAIDLYGDHAAIGYLMNFYAPACTRGRVSNMSEYFAVGKQICEKWGIPYLDMYNNAGITAAMQPATTTYLPDYIHPNGDGYEVLYPYIAAFMETLTPYAAAPRNGVIAALNGQIRLGFMLDVNWYEGASKVLVTAPNVDGEEETAEYDVSAVPLGARYQVNAHVAPAQMAYPVTVELKNSAGETLLKVSDYSVQKYLTALTAYEELAELAEATLIYGSAAQDYFAEEAGISYPLPIEDYAARLAGITADEVIGKSVLSVSGERPAGVSAVSVAAVLDNTVGIRFFFTAPQGDYTFLLDGKAVTPTYSDGRYCVRLTGITANRMETPHSVTVNGSYTVSYSVLTYAAAAINYGGKLSGVAKALYYYSEAALAYENA